MRRLVGRTLESKSPRSSLLGSRIPLSSLIQTVAVAEYLNFRHAASFLGTSQSSVSTRIKTLEEDLGVLLFERRHRGVRLTEAGRIFVAEVTVGIEHLDHAIKTAGVISGGTVGRLGIGLHSSIAAGFLADLRSQYRDQYPDVEQMVVEGQLRRLFQGSGGVVSGGSTMSGGVDPHHPSGCDHTGDGGSGHC